MKNYQLVIGKDQFKLAQKKQDSPVRSPDVSDDNIILQQDEILDTNTKKQGLNIQKSLSDEKDDHRKSRPFININSSKYIKNRILESRANDPKFSNQNLINSLLTTAKINTQHSIKIEESSRIRARTDSFGTPIIKGSKKHQIKFEEKKIIYIIPQIQSMEDLQSSNQDQSDEEESSDSDNSYQYYQDLSEIQQRRLESAQYKKIIIQQFSKMQKENQQQNMNKKSCACNIF